MEHRISSPGAPSKGPSGTARRLLTIAEAADILAISIASVRRLIAASQLPVVRFNRRLLVDNKDLDAFIQRAKQPGI